MYVAYWPPARPSSQKKKCTCVNNWCIRSKISDQGRPWLSRGWIECEIIMLAGSTWASNYYITLATGSSGQLERRCWNEDHVPEKLGPQLNSPGERERNAVMAIRVGVNMLQFCSVSNSLSHTTLSIKWEVYFSKELCPFVFIVSSLWFCMHMSMQQVYSSERDLAPMKKWYWKLRHILRLKTNCSIKRHQIVRETLESVYHPRRKLCWWIKLNFA